VCACVCVCGFVSAHVWWHASVYTRVYAYRIHRLNQRALLDQHSHRFHVTVLARVIQRCLAVLPSQPASVRRSGAAAATQATVKCVGSMHVCPSIMCEVK
jgi:hypothetical protein